MKILDAIIFDNVKRLFPSFGLSNYKKEFFNSTPKGTLIEINRLYNSNLPIDLKSWTNVNEKLYPYLKEYIDFICGTLCFLILNDLQAIKDNPPLIIKVIEDKQFMIPLYCIKNPILGLEIYIEHTGNRWKLSICSGRRIHLYDLINPITPQNYIIMPEDKRYDCLYTNPIQFSVELYDKYEVYTLFYIMRHFLERRNYRD